MAEGAGSDGPEWYCQAEEAGFTYGYPWCTAENPTHGQACGWNPAPVTWERLTAAQRRLIEVVALAEPGCAWADTVTDPIGRLVHGGNVNRLMAEGFLTRDDDDRSRVRFTDLGRSVWGQRHG